ncbi:phosphate signaling complex protein PhoU [Chloroflexota bacterium]
MSRETLDRLENELMDDLIELCSMVIQSTLDSVAALKNRDISASRKIYDRDELINQKRFAIENDTITAIATQQPMATDLRVLTSILEISIELERMGDYAKGIAKINIRLGEDSLLKPLVDIPIMAEYATQMLHQALNAFIEQDIEQSLAICAQDDKIDKLYKKVYRDLIEIVVKDPSTADKANFLLWAAHYLERLGDRVTNICERTIYVKTGELTDISDSL